MLNVSGGTPIDAVCLRNAVSRRTAPTTPAGFPIGDCNEYNIESDCTLREEFQSQGEVLTVRMTRPAALLSAVVGIYG